MTIRKGRQVSVFLSEAKGEKMTQVISGDNIEIIGRHFTGALYAHMIHEDGRPYHTFRTPTVIINGSHVRCTDCTFENTAGSGREVGQAIALTLDGDEIVLDHCTLRAHQDTLFLAPLPEKEKEKDGFLGPQQFTPRTPRTVYIRNCLIEGDVDFVFGGATAYFENCEFRSVGRGYVFAPSTPEDVKYGFIVKNCRFTCTDNVEDRSCYIGRPWREFGMVHLENCELGRHIHPDGWNDWNKPHEHIRFSESGSYGPGAEGKRPDFVIVC